MSQMKPAETTVATTAPQTAPWALKRDDKTDPPLTAVLQHCRLVAISQGKSSGQHQAHADLPKTAHVHTAQEKADLER